MRNALIDSKGVLLSHGFCNFVLSAGQSQIQVADDFSLTPGQFQWNGTSWVAYVDPAVVAAAALAAARAADNATVKAQIAAVGILSGSLTDMDAFVDTNVVDIASAKVLLKLIVRVLAVTARRAFPDLM